MRITIVWAGLLVVALSWIPAHSGVIMTEVSVDAFRNAEGVPIDIMHSPLGDMDGEGTLLPNQFGPGVTWTDINSDGWPDLIMGNGSIGVEGYGTVGNFMLLNNGDGSFTEVAEWYGFQESFSANGISAADVNNDGQVDLVVGHMGTDPHFFVGRGERYDEIGEYWGVNPLFWDPWDPPVDIVPETMGTAYGDYDADGYVDIYFANYLHQRDLLFRSLSGTYFARTELVDVTNIGYGFQAVFLDFDNDVDLDIYVTNDFGYNFLFENQGPDQDYAFDERGKAHLLTGGDHGEDKSMAMGVAVGDFDNDLDLDIYVCNYYLNALYINEGPDTPVYPWRFREAAAEKGVEWPWNCWGVDLADLDLDGDLDLMFAGGWIGGKPGVAQEFYLPDKMYLNNGPPDYDFTEISDAAGFNDLSLGRGLATADYDRDGDPDVAVANASYHDPGPEPGATIYEGYLKLYRNDQDENNHWVIVKLQGGGVHSPGSGCNRSAIGARVYLSSGDLVQMREIRAGNSFLSQSALDAEFGLGTRDTIDEVRVRWPCGQEEIFGGVVPDACYLLIEAEGEATALPVALTSFQAIPLREGIRLEWVTAPGVRVRECRVLRCVAEDDELAMQEILPEMFSEEGRSAALDRSVQSGVRYAYQLRIIGEDGIEVESALVFARADSDDSIPSRPLLSQNFPNPFNPNTNILFHLPKAGKVRLVIHDARGRRVRALYHGFAEAGETRLQWDGTDDSGDSVSSGVYTYTLETERGSLARRLVLMK